MRIMSENKKRNKKETNKIEKRTIGIIQRRTRIQVKTLETI